MFSAPANLDGSFGQNGASELPAGFYAEAISAAPGNGIYIAANGGGQNNIDLFHYNANGSLDAGFGNAGMGSIDAGLSATPSKIIRQSDGKILVACMWNATTFDPTTSGILARFNADGTPDTNFGSNGTATVTGHDNILTNGKSRGNIVDTMLAAVSVSGDGKITAVSKDGINIQLERFNTDGSPDASFGPDGLKFIPMQSTPNIAGEDIVAGTTPDGGLVVDEIYYPLDPTTFYFVPMTEFRIDSTGNLASKTDVSLPPGFRHAEAGSVGPNGQMVFYNIGDASAVANLNANRDPAKGPTFTAGGTEPVDNGYPAGDPTLSVAPDGKIVIVGSTSDGNSAVQRLNVDGSPDRTFSNGQVISGLGNAGLSMALPLDDGSVIVIGGRSDDTGFTTILYKLLPGGEGGAADPVPVDPATLESVAGLDASNLLVPPGQLAGGSTGEAYHGLFANKPIGVLGDGTDTLVFDAVVPNA